MEKPKISFCAFSFVNLKYFIYQSHVGGIGKKTICHQGCLSLGHHQNFKKMQRWSLGPYWKASIVLPWTLGNENLGCGVSTIMGYKWKGRITKFSHSPKFLLKATFMQFIGCWWKCENFSCHVLKSSFDLQFIFFKMTMLHNLNAIMQKDN